MRMSIKRLNPALARIEIKIKDDGKYADVALFIDKPDVLEDIYSFRKKWIGDKLVENGEIDDYINKDRTSSESKKFWGNYLAAIRLIKQENFPQTYIQPFIAAILTGVVTDKDYSTIIKEFLIDNLPEDLKFELPVIFSSFRVRKSDLIRLNKNDTNAIHTIKRDRQWYWDYVTSGRGIGFRTLAKKYYGDAESDWWHTVRSAILAYEKKLTTPTRK